MGSWCLPVCCFVTTENREQPTHKQLVNIRILNIKLLGPRYQEPTQSSDGEEKVFKSSVVARQGQVQDAVQRCDVISGDGRHVGQHQSSTELSHPAQERLLCLQ